MRRRTFIDFIIAKIAVNAWIFKISHSMWFLLSGCVRIEMFSVMISRQAHILITAFVLLDIHFMCGYNAFILMHSCIWACMMDLSVAANISELILISNVVTHLFQNICFWSRCKITAVCPPSLAREARGFFPSSNSLHPHNMRAHTHRQTHTSRSLPPFKGEVSSR